MHLGQGGPDHPRRERGGQEEAGGDEDGGADEGGEEGTVDGLPPGTWLGKERPMSWTVEENSIKYFPNHTLYLYLSKNPLNISISFCNKCWKKKIFALLLLKYIFEFHMGVCVIVNSL